MNGTSVVECSSVKLSSTNVKLDTGQASIRLGIGGKLLETLRQLIESSQSGMHHIECTVNENTNMNILFHFRQELGTCVDCKPNSIASTFET